MKRTIHREPPAADRDWIEDRPETDDLVQEASEGSFPASDPPGWIPMTTIGCGRVPDCEEEQDGEPSRDAGR